MGLAASQARLLTITSRQADCEYQSMRYSHQKLELSRSMTDVSNEYQDALDATKLVYDFYGTGDTSTSLSYGLFMTPSELNGYMPTLITDASGKVLLSSRYAEAAKAAGIPQEGLGCLPSSTMRDKFLEGLYSSGVISKTTLDTCKSIEYSQDIGLGSTDLVTTSTTSMTAADLAAYLDECGFYVDFSGFLDSVGNNTYGSTKVCSVSIDGSESDATLCTFSDLLNSDYSILTVSQYSKDGKYDTELRYGQNMSDFQNWDFWDTMFDAVESVLDTGDSDIKQVLADARAKTEALIYVDYPEKYGGTLDSSEEGLFGTGFGGLAYGWSDYESWKETRNALLKNSSEYIGYYGIQARDGSHDERYSGLTLSVSNIFKAYLTYIAEGLEGLYSDYYVDDTAFEVTGRLDKNKPENNGETRTVSDSNLIDSTSDYEFTVVTDTGINSGQALIAGFYDALFNQLCTRGWVENNNVTDEEYLQEMLQTGKLYLATCSDDGYYNQGNYSTNTYIKEVTDDEAIAQSEAKYNTEKLKIENKEEIIDLKMKNLDTEISSLSTEYDTVKSLISKNAERSFKRYDA